MSPATRQRIREIADELGYRPSVAARALRTGVGRTISVIVPDDAWGWYEPVVRAAFQAASAQGCQLIVHPIAGLSGGAAAVIDSLASTDTDGVLLFGLANEPRLLEAAERQRLPIVSIGDNSDVVLMPTVAPQSRAGARAVVEHLLDQGRRRIAVVLSWGDAFFARERLAGYCEALDAAEVAARRRSRPGSAGGGAAGDPPHRPPRGPADLPRRRCPRRAAESTPSSASPAGLRVELTDHLGYEKGDPAGQGSGNSRNGTTPKRLGTEVGDLDLATPRETVMAASTRSWSARASAASAASPTPSSASMRRE